MQEKNNSTINVEKSGELTQHRSRRRKSEKPSGSFHPVYKGIVITVLLFLSLTAGLFVGFSVVGDGNALEAFNWSTYQHIYDLVFKTNS